ncbi:MAG: YggT family protein [SAR324 cluster bacterium]|nr:YggT family protein [SAR324 cluster bacterium]MCZ6626683.1 YggT family protein [SAR324 cluster bacterium]
MSSLFEFSAEVTRWALTIYEWIIIIAILVSWVNPDPRNPIVQFLNNMTYPLWNYLGRQLPAGLKLFAAYFSLLLVWFLKVFLPGTLLTLGAWSGAAIGFDAVPMRIFGFFLLGLGIVLQNLLFFLMLLLLVWFFLTLISPSVNSPIVRTVFVLVDPFITPIQKWLPRTKVDFSPLVAAGIFLVLKMVVVAQLIVFSAGLANYSAAGALS